MNLAKIKQFWTSKSKREKIMLIAVLWVGAAVWFSVLSGKSTEIKEERAILDGAINVAQTAIKQEKAISLALEKMKASFDSNKTISASDLQLFAEKCATDCALEYWMSAVTQKDAKDFQINSISLSCKNADIKSLASFEQKLREKEPYVFVEKVDYAPASNALSAKYLIVSIQLK